MSLRLRKVPGYDVLISRDAKNIISMRSGQALKIQKHRQGYAVVPVSPTGRNNCSNLQTVQRLLALAYLPNPNFYPYVRFKNGIKTDIRLANLYWAATRSGRPSFTGKMMINNGKQTRWIERNQRIPEGWSAGNYKREKHL